MESNPSSGEQQQTRLDDFGRSGAFCVQGYYKSGVQVVREIQIIVPAYPYLIVDDEDYEVMRHRSLAFRLDATAVNRKFKDILGIERSLTLDHINGDHLDYRRLNLRGVTASQNAQNRSGCRKSSSQFKGVSRVTEGWAAKIGLPGKKTKQIGTFQTEEEAALAYDLEAIELYGEYARLNLDRSGR